MHSQGVCEKAIAMEAPQEEAEVWAGRFRLVTACVSSDDGAQVRNEDGNLHNDHVTSAKLSAYVQAQKTRAYV
eukprot:110050-Pleurochrysis_carterae.AAC.2